MSKYVCLFCWWPFSPFLSPSLSLHFPPFASYSNLLMCLLSFSGPVDISLMSKCAPCLAAPCQNNGTCVSEATGSYHCTCPYGFKVRYWIAAEGDTFDCKVETWSNILGLANFFFLVYSRNFTSQSQKQKNSLNVEDNALKFTVWQSIFPLNWKKMYCNTSF